MEENIPNFTIYGKDTILTIKNNKTLNVKNLNLEINITDLSLTICEGKENFGKKITDCKGIIGIIVLEEDTYLIVITKALLVCTIQKKEIYKVLDTNSIKLSENFEEIEAEEKSEGCNEEYDSDTDIIIQLKDKFKNGFYFSNGYDLANSLTSQNQIINFFTKEKRLISDYDYIAEGNKNFLANYKLTAQIMTLKEKQNIKYFFSNCIYGNIEEFSYEKEKIEIILISRRYLWNYGIFNYRRGLSKYGGNSNQIETEIILIHDSKEIYSNIYLSSYLPIYFKNKKYLEMNVANKAFIKYFKTLTDEYNFLFLFAIKSDDKDDKYIAKFKTLLRQNMKSIGNRWKYYYINSKENKTIKDSINKSSKNFVEYIGYNLLKDNILVDQNKNQSGIISFLSMDNKTLNQNQLILIYQVLFNIISDLSSQGKLTNFLNKDANLDFNRDDIKINNIHEVDDQPKIEINEIKTETNINEEESFIQHLILMLKNRDKELSSQYYTNYGFDLTKKYQRTYEILFGKNMKFLPLKSNLDDHREEFSDIEKIKMYVATWNTSSTEQSKICKLNLDSLLIPKDSKIIPDIYFVGLQEVVKLNATNIIITGEEKLQQILSEWDKKINESIQKIGKYKKLVIMNLVGINFFAYILEDKFDKVKNISKKIVKTGFGGTTGNKGSCVINFEYENTSISVSCSHLVANKKNKRLKELEYILNLKLNTFYNPDKLKDKSNDQQDLISQSLEEIMAPEDDTVRDQHSNSVVITNPNNISNSNTLSKIETINNNNDLLLFKDSDIWILFGDLNFRIDMEYEEFSEFIKKGNSWDKLLDYDQFVKYQLASLSSMTNIQEDLIKFAPTYKYIINSDEFDYTPENKIQNPNQKENENLHKSGKKRNPSWCDRIFYKKNSYMTKEGKKIITGLEYNNVMDKNFQSSDHRPVYEIFEAIIFKENPDKKILIEKEIISNENLGISNKYMKQKNYDY